MEVFQYSLKLTLPHANNPDHSLLSTSAESMSFLYNILKRGNEGVGQQGTLRIQC